MFPSNLNNKDLHVTPKSEEICTLVAKQTGPERITLQTQEIYDDDYYESLAADYDNDLNNEESKYDNDYSCCERAECGLKCNCEEFSSEEISSDDGTFGGREPMFSSEDLLNRYKDRARM
jgi:hypothetical protein